MNKYLLKNVRKTEEYFQSCRAAAVQMVQFLWFICFQFFKDIFEIFYLEEEKFSAGFKTEIFREWVYLCRLLFIHDGLI